MKDVVVMDLLVAELSQAEKFRNDLTNSRNILGPKHQNSKMWRERLIC